MGRRPGPSLGRKDVVAAALHVVNTEGASALGINRVARELGIKPPSIYNHIKNGDELRTQVAIAGWDRLYAQIRPEWDAAETSPQKVKALFEQYRTFALSKPALYEVMSQVALPSDDPEFREVARRILSLFGGLFEDRTGTPTNVRVHTLRTIRSVIHGFILLESNDQFDPAFESDASYEWITSLMIAALNGERRPSDA